MTDERKLSIRTSEGSLVCVLSWRNGRVVEYWSVSRLKADLARWLDDGLDEWVGEGEASMPRSTLSSEPEFLSRLGSYLSRQFGFVVKDEKP